MRIATGKPFMLERIRAGRKKPGLLRQIEAFTGKRLRTTDLGDGRFRVAL